jgi:hypothetical protein
MFFLRRGLFEIVNKKEIMNIKEKEIKKLSKKFDNQSFYLNEYIPNS